ncbi:MAG TPA: Dyp-type peroxidase [Arachnia sp.]|nr:Dyp-type peroxidase [Arachnia sp.]
MSPVSRRGLFGYAGATGVGAAAGVAGGWATKPAAAEPHQVLNQRYSAHGAHQSGILTPTAAANQLVALDLLPATDVAALGRLMRSWTGLIEALMEGRPTAGDTLPDLAQEAVSMSVLVGYGPAIFDLPGLAAKRPAGFQDIPPMNHDELDERWSGGDLLLWVSADDGTSVDYAVRRLVADAAPFARRRWTQTGSWRGFDGDGKAVTGRNLFGQVDGSGNPDGEQLDEALWSADDWLTGGTQLVVRRIEMNLDTWDEATRDRQEASIGRNLADGAPLTGETEADDLDLDATEDGVPVIALDAHARRSHPDANNGRRMLRRGVNYTHEEWKGGELTATAGLIFCAFQASLADQFIPVQRALDDSDALNEWTTAIGSAVFAIPPGYAQGGWVGETLLG